MTGQLFEMPAEKPKQQTKDQDSKDLVDQMMYWLSAPYLTWPGQESIYELNDNKNRAMVRRLAQHKEIWETKQCSLFESMLYISTSTLENPPSHHLANVYFWLFRQEMPEAADQAMGESGKGDLEPQEKGLLADVRSWIFRQQLNRMKARGFGDTPELRQEEVKLHEEQRRLF